MGSFCLFLGRFLFISIFVLSGFQKVQSPGQSAPMLSTNYAKFHKWVFQYLGQFPQVSPQNIQQNSEQIIFYTGIFLIIAATMILTAIRGGGFLVFLFLVLATAIFHNPYLQSTASNTTKSYYDFVQNAALAGGALMMCCGFCLNKEGKK